MTMMAPGLYRCWIYCSRGLQEQVEASGRRATVHTPEMAVFQVQQQWHIGASEGSQTVETQCTSAAWRYCSRGPHSQVSQAATA